MILVRAFLPRYLIWLDRSWPYLHIRTGREGHGVTVKEVYRVSEKAFRYCSASPTCRNLTRGGPCAEHARPAWRREQPPPARIRGAKLQKLRAELHAREPWCRICNKLLTLGEMIRDHIVNLEEGGQDVAENCQPICVACHRVKTEAEAKRGMVRSR